MRISHRISLVVAALLSVPVLAIAIATLFPALSNSYTMGGTALWVGKGFGPLLFLLSVVAVGLAIPSAVRQPRKPIVIAVVTLAAGALIWSGAINGTVIIATIRDGGSFNVAEALTLPGYSNQADQTEAYTIQNGTRLATHVFEPQKLTNAPVMMYIHGGGWNSGAAAGSATQSRWFADHGWLVVNVDYRLATANHATWDEAPADVACALGWTVERARSMGADVSRLVVAGDSSGGHLATLLGWSASEGKATSSCPSLGKTPVPNAIVASYPVDNPAYTYDHGVALGGQDPQTFTTWFLGGKPTEEPDRLKAISPSTYLSADVPRTLILQPTHDDFIPAEGNYQLAAAAKAAGADVAIVEVPFAFHGYDSRPSSLGWQAKLTVAENWLHESGVGPQN